MRDITIGIVGGNGMLGSAIGRGLLARGGLTRPLLISSRSGRAGGLEGVAGVEIADSNQALADRCDVVVLSVPPESVTEIGVRAPSKLVISVMAGVTLGRMAQLTGAGRAVRAMSSPAAARGLAYSPFTCAPAVSDADRATVTALFSACGLVDEVPDEVQVEYFTALTGPVPGFVAAFAAAMVAHAQSRGVAPGVADRAVRQLFLASGRALAEETASPAQQVQAMRDYAGTTAAGLEAMLATPLERAIGAGLDAAARRAREMG